MLACSVLTALPYYQAIPRAEGFPAFLALRLLQAQMRRRRPARLSTDRSSKLSPWLPLRQGNPNLLWLCAVNSGQIECRLG